MSRKWIWAGLIVLIFLGGSEWISRLVSSENISISQIGMQLQPHPTRIWSMTPGTQTQFGVNIQVDSNGMRQTDVVSDSLKWLTLGDSSIFGHGLNDNETLHHHLEEALRLQQLNIDVLCGATPGYSTLQTLDYLRDIGWDLNPDVLVIGNLWSDNNFDHFQDQIWMNTLQTPQNKTLQILSRSVFFVQVSKLLRPELWSNKSDESTPHAKISWVRDPYSKGVRRVPIPLYIETLSTILDEAQQKDIAVIVIQPANRHRLAIVNEELTWDPYFKAQAAVAHHYGVPIIDVAPSLRAFGVKGNEAFLDQMHPTSTANYWISQSIVGEWNQQQSPLEQWIPSGKGVPSIEIVDRWTSNK